jgi:hypothetical protein
MSFCVRSIIGVITVLQHEGRFDDWTGSIGLRDRLNIEKPKMDEYISATECRQEMQAFLWIVRRDEGSIRTIK